VEPLSHRISFWFSKYFRRVLFVENIPKKNPSASEMRSMPVRIENIFRKGKRHKRYGCLLAQSCNIKMITPFAFPSNCWFFNYLNRKIWIKKLCGKLAEEYGIENPLVWCYLPVQSALDLIDLLDPELLAYDCITNFAEDYRSPSDISRTEKRLIEKADIVTCDSDFLCRGKAGRGMI
jgi:hypothetical protein